MRNIFEMDKLRDIKSAIRLNKCGKTFKNITTISPKRVLL